MTSNGYPEFDMRGNMVRLLSVMRALESVDLEGIIDSINRAHVVAPVTDPTAYREALASGEMEAVAELARELQPAMRVWNEKIRPRIPD